MPIVATIIQMSISRSREYAADKGAAMLTQNPQGLIDALSKLENYARSGAMLQNATPQSAHMFIINPFNGLKIAFHLFLEPIQAHKIELTHLKK